MPQAHWAAHEATSEEYLGVFADYCKTYLPLRDKYTDPEAELWVTESGDAAGGGNTWASTYLDVIRTLNELGGFATMANGVIFHNTLASSDYGFLARDTFEPRPNYFAALLWTRLMGDVVYDSGIPVAEGAHVYCHSRKDGNQGYAYLVINNSLTETTEVKLPKTAKCYELSAAFLRADIMRLNGKDLKVNENADLPAITPVMQSETVKIPPCGCTFLLI